MCGIAGFCDPKNNFGIQRKRWIHVLNEMNHVQKHRGPDDEGIYLERHCGLSQVRLSIIDLSTGQYPMSWVDGNKRITIVYDGEIYNMHELKKDLENQGAVFETKSDTEVILAGYIKYGTSFVTKLNGVFAFAIWDERMGKLFLFRDRVGVKSLFYTKLGNTLVFATELKGILSYPGMEAKIDKEGLCEILGLGPAKTYGKGVFKGVYEVLPGYYLEYDRTGKREYKYWELVSSFHEDSLEETIEKTSFLVSDAVHKQMLSNVPISTLLSGGVDSSLITAICAEELEKQGKVLNTFSFDFQDNAIHFKENEFQPSRDRPWVDRMVEHSKTKHHYLECNNTNLYEYLFKAVDARDLPCMADIESSMLYFCSKVVEHNKVTLSGECADEIFGGYPWFHKKECFEADTFPWSMDMEPRKILLQDDLLAELPMEEYVHAAYERTIQETPVLDGEVGIEKRRREIAYLNLKWFMATLLDRADRTSMFSGLETRVPFADYRIVEYIWNVPWDMKCLDGTVKGLLRKVSDKYLPPEVAHRKKSPYPKTYHPEYENLIRSSLMEVMADTNAPIHQLIDSKKLEIYLKNSFDYGKPFYGQLMAGPQMLAYLLQINYWLKTYGVQLV